MQQSTLLPKFGSAVTFFAVAMLLLYPALSVAVKGGMNAVFFLTVGCSLYLLFADWQGGEKPAFGRAARAYFVAMMLPAVAILLNQLSRGVFDLHPYDAAARFLLAPLIYLALANTRINFAPALEMAFPLGAAASLVVADLTPTYGGRAVTYFLDAIHFGDLALLFGFLSLFSINWLRRDPRLVLAFKWAGFVAGMYTSILSGTRGGWIAVPFLATLWLFWATRNYRKITRVFMVLTVLAGCLAGYLLSDMVRQRVDNAISGFTSYKAGQVDTGTAARLELWKASYLIFEEHPFIGVGDDGYKQMLTRLYERGAINERVMLEGQAEAHSEIAGNAARYGIVGLITIFALYLVPIWNFGKLHPSKIGLSAGAARMGICVAVSFLIFGLTVETFGFKMVAAFYAFTIAVLLAAGANKRAGVTSELTAGAANK